MDRRFDRVDEREVLGHFNEVYRRLERLKQEYSALTDESGRRESLERDLTVLKEQVTVLLSRIGDIERRLSGSTPSP